MGRPLIVRAARARAIFAAHCLPKDETVEALGSITLHAHQRAAIARIRVLLGEHRGALLADDAGLGKTYVAAAIMRDATQPLLVIPAALRQMWRHALAATGAHATLVTYTSLSRGRLPTGDYDLIVLDEAHHARTATTRRYKALASVAMRAPVLLLTATPVHNRREELASLLALFLGEGAYAMDSAAISKLVVRRERGDISGAVPLPEGPAPVRIQVHDDAPLLAALTELPPPLPPSDGGMGGVLLTWSLLRQWASSRAALAGALRRRLARGIALESALEAGRYPDRRELRAWSASDDAVQLAFPQLVAAPTALPAALLIRVRTHLAAVRELLLRLREDDGVDASRASAIREIRARHAGEKLLVFSQYTDSVHAMFAHLRGEPGIAALSSHGARIASGRLSRQEALERFAPRASNAPMPKAFERIDVLLATDLASEGLNLHDASVVVHLDLPWTPARLEQRVARSRRIGALHARTHSYVLAPPAGAESVLAIERRLRQKLHVTEEILGSTGAVLPEPPAGDRRPSSESGTRLRERINGELQSWRADSATECTGGQEESPIAVACVAAPRNAVLALALDGAQAVLAAALDVAELSENASVVLSAMELAIGVDAIPDDIVLPESLARAHRWLARRAGATAGAAVAWRGMSRRIALRRIAALSARAPLHTRALLAPLAMAARRVVSAPYALGAERVLDELASAPLPDEAWLRALVSFGAMHGRRESEPSSTRIVAVIIALEI